LIRHVQLTVQRTHGVMLEPEVRIIGEAGAACAAGAAGAADAANAANPAGAAGEPGAAPVAAANGGKH